LMVNESSSKGVTAIPRVEEAPIDSSRPVSG
jgi:hypothetical protein